MLVVGGTDAAPARLAMADVERNPVGRRAILLPLSVVSFPLPAEESCRSRVVVALLGSPLLSPVLLTCRADVGV